MMKRRDLLALFVGVPVAAIGLWQFPWRARAGAGAAAASGPQQARWQDFLNPSAAVASDPSPLQKPASAWRAELPAESYAVLFEEDTEPPFSSHLNLEKRPGLFVCRACRLPLFTSEMKYESGTGWPSFFTSIPGHLATKTDLKILIPRTEYHCVKCGGHQGHVFDDGPAPSGERWCNNGVALTFIALQ